MLHNQMAKRTSPLLLMLVGLLVGLLGCNDAPFIVGMEPLPPTGQLEQPIINGTTDTGHPVVGLLEITFPNNKALWCSSTLVGSQTVLTAAHCLVWEKKPPYTKASKVEFFLDAQYQNGKLTGTKLQVATFDYHPSYLGEVSSGPPLSDVAVVRLSQPVSGVTPIRVAPGATYKGEPVTLVGYGRTGKDNEDSGTKRTAKNEVENITSEYFTFKGATGAEGNVCSGDSGGPVFASRGGQEVLVGVNSASTCPIDDSDPTQITGFSMRADVFYGWIEQKAQGDLYKGGFVDVDTPVVTILKPASDTQVSPSFNVQADVQDKGKIKQVTLRVDGKAMGTKNAPPFTFQVKGHPAGPHEIEVEAIDQAGHVGAASATVSVVQLLPFGSPCTADTECNGGRCVTGTCSRSCSAPADCPQGYDCTGAVCVESQGNNPETPGGGGGSSTTPGSPDVGQYCDGSHGCPGGFCVQDPVTGSRFCTVACDLENDTCPAGMACHPTGSTQTAVCGPRHDEAGGQETHGAKVDLTVGACNLAGAPGGGLALPLLLLGLLLIVRRFTRP